jgi:hypothetical protein
LASRRISGSGTQRYLHLVAATAAVAKVHVVARAAGACLEMLLPCTRSVNNREQRGRTGTSTPCKPAWSLQEREMVDYLGLHGAGFESPLAHEIRPQGVLDRDAPFRFGVRVRGRPLRRSGGSSSASAAISRPPAGPVSGAALRELCQVRNTTMRARGLTSAGALANVTARCLRATRAATCLLRRTFRA